MELSTVPRPQLENVPSDGRCQVTPPAGLKLFDVPVPVDLRRFGETVRAATLGHPKNPTVVVLCGISANCFPAVQSDGMPGWWSGLAGDGQAVDPKDFHVVGLDFAADDSGISAPSTADQARVLAAALDANAVDRPVTIVSASYGGMVGLDLAAAEPARVERLVAVSAGAEPHPASTAARELP